MAYYDEVKREFWEDVGPSAYGAEGMPGMVSEATPQAASLGALEIPGRALAQMITGGVDTPTSMGMEGIDAPVDMDPVSMRGPLGS